MKRWKMQLIRLLAMLLVCFLSLQLYFVCRIALMRIIDPQSTTFQRSERLRLMRSNPYLPWQQEWLSYEKIAPSLKRAVIASEDDGFVHHNGFDWAAIEFAWERNQVAQNRVQQYNQRLSAKLDETSSSKISAAQRKNWVAQVQTAKILGGSTISQQLAKNLFLSGERSYLRKIQELLITLYLEALLNKQRLLEIYLNSVEWGEGLFGAGAAAAYYYRLPASELGHKQAARLALLLPAPKKFAKIYFPRSAKAYLGNINQEAQLNQRLLSLYQRMQAAKLP